jgi:hypothetical protein
VSQAIVCVRELAGWDLDDDGYRPAVLDRGRLDQARILVNDRAPFEVKSALCEIKDCRLIDKLAAQEPRTDLHAEMLGLDWFLGVVDLRHLLAFQRRIVLNTDVPGPAPAADDWDALIDLCFGSPKPVACEITQSEASIVFRSSNPNLHFRVTQNNTSPIAIHTGSPFFEVAQYRGRWFLRDGYHRAFQCLKSGISRLPAVIVRARSREELGAVQPWFFPEEVLFSSAPPRVIDFLDDELVIKYNRFPLIKTLRITMEETYALQGGDL